LGNVAADTAVEAVLAALGVDLAAAAVLAALGVDLAAAAVLAALGVDLAAAGHEVVPQSYLEAVLTEQQVVIVVATA
jgi:hypothetical protein